MDFLNQAIQNKYINDKYYLIMPVPEALRTIDTLSLDNVVADENKVMSPLFMLALRTANIPSINVPSVSIKQYAQSIKVSSHAREDYEDVTVEWEIDNRFGSYYYLYKWLNLLNNDELSDFDHDNYSPGVYKNDKKGNKILQAHKNYAVDCTIVPIDEFGKPIIYFSFEGLFPVSISNIDLNDQTPGPVTVSATFAFSRFNISFNNPIEGLLINSQVPLQPTTTTLATTTLATTTTTCPTTTKGINPPC